MEQINAIFAALGLDPALAGIGVVLAIMLRYLRGMVHGFTSEWTYAAAVAFGVLGAWLKSDGLTKGFALNALALACVVLVLQKVLEKAAASVSWLPQDNEWTRK